MPKRSKESVFKGQVVEMTQKYGGRGDVPASFGFKSAVTRPP